MSSEPSESNLEREQELEEVVSGDSPESAPPLSHVEEMPETVSAPESRAGMPMKRLHSASIVFDVMAHFKSYIIPAGIGLFSAASGRTEGLYFAAIFLVPSILYSIIRYFTLRFVIKNNELVVTQGLISRQVRIVPVSRIQNVDLLQNVLHRLFNVAEVRVETAGGNEPEAILRVLSMPEVDALRAAIFASQETANKPEEAEESKAFSGAVEQASHRVLSIPIGWLVKIGLTSNRGMVLVGILFGLYVQFDQEMKLLEGLKLGRLARDLPVQLGLVGQVLVGFGAAIAFLFVLRLVSVAWFVLRFHGYRMSRAGEDLRIRCGLLTKVSATVPIRRIQFISVQQNLLMRYMKLASVRIETAGGAGSEGENPATTVARRWFVPVMPIFQVPSILSQLRTDLDWDLNQLDWQGLAPKARARLLRLAIIQSLLFIFIGGCLAFCQVYFMHAKIQFWSLSIGLPFLFAPILVFHAIKKSRSKRYARTESGVVYQSGIWTRKTSVTFFEKIQSLSVSQSPFDRRWKMATLAIDTAAAGPADHLIEIPYLDARFAEQEFDALNQKSATNEPRYS